MPFKDLVNQRVTLTSRAKPFAVAYYSKQHYITQINEQTLFRPNGIIYNIYDTTRKRQIISIFSSPDVRRKYTFTVPLGLFVNLQYTLDSIAHTYNEVLATQGDASTELSLHKYYSFSTLRSGHRLQLPNILRKAVSDALDFARPKVHLLISQALWQVGPEDSSGSVLRETYGLLRDDRFIAALLQALEDYLERIARSWTNAQALLIFSALASRVLSLSDIASVYRTCLAFLRRARAIALQQLRSIQERDDRDPRAYNRPIDERHTRLIETALIY